MKAKVWVAVAVGVAGGALLACIPIEQITSNRVMVATLLGTPKFSVSASGFADGGVVLASDGGTEAVVVAFLGELPRESLDDPPEPIADADFDVITANGRTTQLTAEGGGRYGASSANTNLAYVNGADYQFQAKLQGEADALVAAVDDVPPQETITAFHPSSGVVVHSAGQPFVFTRPDPTAGVERPFGFVTVFPIGGDGTQGQPTYTNVPVDAIGLLRMVINPNAYKQTQVTVPATAFPSANANYVIVFQAAKLGRATSTNLSPLSAILAGVADLGAIHTQ